MGSLDYSKRRGRDGRWLGELQWSKANLESVSLEKHRRNERGFPSLADPKGVMEYLFLPENLHAK